MYDKPDSQYNQLVMAVQERLKLRPPGSGVSETRAKSAGSWKSTSHSKMVISEPPYEVITQQITYLMSAITNQNVNNNGQNGSRHNNGNGKFSNTKT